MKRRYLGLLAVIAVVGATLWLGLATGTTSFDLMPWRLERIILWDIRGIRVLQGLMAGASLSVGGLILQALLRNPLADPYLMGIAGGAALGGVVPMSLGWALIAVPLGAAGGAFLSMVVLLALAHRYGRTDAHTLLLMGVVFNAVAAALVTVIKMLVTSTKAQELLLWLMGSLGPETSIGLPWVVGAALIGTALAWRGAGVLDLMSLGDGRAAAMGLRVEAARLWFFALAACLVGSVVAFCGMISFVGLVVPHVMREIFGARHRMLVPAAAIGGGGFMVAADAVARGLFHLVPTELPVGAMTAFAGGPFFLFLLLRSK